MVLAKALTNRRTTNCWTDVKKLERHSLRWHCHDHVSTMSQSLRQRSLWRQNIAKQKWKKNTEWGAGEVGTRYRMVVWLEEDNGFFFSYLPALSELKIVSRVQAYLLFLLQYRSNNLEQCLMLWDSDKRKEILYICMCVWVWVCAHIQVWAHTHVYTLPLF